ncbi:unnamed protein product [Allacma fusca]|uniref:Uncharacterized protein n=1 Tax=Allacma fusca TaxID=39272 RepID=A0A8J2JK65_9HEXA|nr:unnamed protein product [Allacma fusca]
MYLLQVFLPYSIGHMFWASWCPIPVNVNNYYGGLPAEYNPILTYANCPVGEVWKPANGSCVGCYCINGFVSRCFLSSRCPGSISSSSFTSSTIQSPKPSPAPPAITESTIKALTTSTPDRIATTIVTSSKPNASVSLKYDNESLLLKLLKNKTVMAVLDKATSEILKGSPANSSIGLSGNNTTKLTQELPEESVTKKSCRGSNSSKLVHEKQESLEDDSEELKKPKPTPPPKASPVSYTTLEPAFREKQTTTTSTTTEIPATTEAETVTEEVISSESEEETTLEPELPELPELPQRRSNDAEMFSQFLRNQKTNFIRTTT